MRSDMPAACTWCHVAQTPAQMHADSIQNSLQTAAADQSEMHNMLVYVCMPCVLTRSTHLRYSSACYQWCTNPEQAATTQQPADSSKQAASDQSNLLSLLADICGPVAMFYFDKPCWLYQAVLACCTNPVHTTGTTPASRQLPLSTRELHNMLWNIRIPVPVCQFGRTHLAAWLC
jgi:hypothetical protein